MPITVLTTVNLELLEAPFIRWPLCHLHHLTSSCILQGCKEITHPFSQDRVVDIDGDFTQRQQDKKTILHGWMWNVYIIPEHILAIEQQVKIQYPILVAVYSSISHPSELRFNRVHATQQFLRRQTCFQLPRSINEPIVTVHSDRFGPIGMRKLLKTYARNSAEPCPGFLDNLK
jgi:hypothetical protein